MSIVLSAAKLAALIVAAIVLFLGQGWLVVGPLKRVIVKDQGADIPLLQLAPLVFVSGLTVHFGILLCVQTLKLSLLVQSVACLAGLGLLTVDVARYRAWGRADRAAKVQWMGAGIASLLFAGPILTTPLTEWDARSIWFFHAKMIDTAGTIGQSAGWSLVSFSHPDYPLLVPGLAAQAANVMGFWNEYLPKISLLFVLLPILAWLSTFARRSFSSFYLLILFPLLFQGWTWNGYMDSFVALYFGIGLLLLGRYVTSSQRIDLVSGLGCLVFLLYLKNEGALALLGGVCAVLLIGLFRERADFIRRLFFLPRAAYLAGLVMVFPYLLWSVYKRQWGLTNDLVDIGSKQIFLNITERLQSGAYWIVLRLSFPGIVTALLLVALLSVAALAWHRRFPVESLQALIAAGFVYVGLFAVYLLTPNDLLWQLRTSVERTMFTVNAGVLVAGYHILTDLENEQISHRQEGALEVVS